MRDLLCRLLGLEWLVVGVSAPFLLFPTVRPMWTAIALGTLAVWWLLRWALRREPWPWTAFNLAMLLLTVMAFAALYFSPFPEQSAADGARLVLGLAVFRSVTLSVDNRRELIIAGVLFLLGGLIIALLSVFATQWPSKIVRFQQLTVEIPRLISSFPEDQGVSGINPNQLAGFLVLYLPMYAALLLNGPHGRNFGYKILFGGLAFSLILLGSILLLTQSRSGWIGGAAGILALLSLTGLTAPCRWARWLGAALPILTVLAIVGAIIYLDPQELGESLFGKEAASPVEEVVGNIALEGRVEIWSRALYAIQDFPFTGCGLGTFRRMVPLLYPLFTVPPDTDIGHAHNIFLQTALDLGIPGLVAYLALLLIALALCWRVALTPSPGPLPSPAKRERGGGAAGGGGGGMRALALGLAAGLVALHVYGLTDALALGSKPAVVFWYALGLIAALGQTEGRDD